MEQRDVVILQMAPWYGSKGGGIEAAGPEVPRVPAGIEAAGPRVPQQAEGLRLRDLRSLRYPRDCVAGPVVREQHNVSRKGSRVES